MTYPATNSNDASKLLIDASNQVHEVVNGTSEETVTTESGEIPTLRKAIIDNFYFTQTNLPWTQGGDETTFNQLREFNGEYYYAPKATVSNPIPMGNTPVGDPNWKNYSTPLTDLVTDAFNSKVAAEAAASTAGYQGLWPDTGGSANKGDTWQTQVGGVPTGNYFTALQNTTVDPVGDNVNWKVSADGGYVNQAQEELIDGKIFPESGVIKNGDTVPVGTTHLRVLIGGESAIVAMTPTASGLVADFTETDATIGGVVVKIFPKKSWKEGGIAYKNHQISFVSENGKEITVFNPSETPIIMGETPYSGGFVGVDELGVFVACDPNGVINANSSFSTASESVDFGSVIRFFGNPKIQGVCECNPVLFRGDGGTVTFDKTLDAGSDGMVFKQGTKVQFQVGMENCTIKIVGSNGGSCFTTPVNNFVDIYPRVSFDNLSFHSDDAGSAGDGFEKVFSWQYYFKLGDSMNMTLSKIDALGSFVIENDPSTQSLDTLIRFEPTQGILSCRISNVTTHNVARYIELKQKTYFHMSDIDIAQCYEGVVDAPDRVFESNLYAYGESIWRNVIINSQSYGVNLANRYQLFAFGLIVNRAAGFDNGQGWVGVKLTRPRNCTLVSPSFSNATGFSGISKGVLIDGGECNSILSPSFGTLTHGIQVGETASVNGAAQAVTVTDATIVATVETVIVNRNSRGLKVRGFNKNSATAYTNFITHGDVSSKISSTITDTPSTFTIRHEDRIEVINDAAPVDEKRTIIDTTNGLTVQTRTDADGVGQNALIIERDGVQVTRTELRASPSMGVVNLNAPETVVFGTFRPSTGNSFACGTASQPWSGGFTQTAFTVTSDVNYKQDIDYNLDSLISAWSEVKYVSYRLKDRINSKGEKARHHVGLVAQDIKSAFEKHGIDPFKYGILCFDEWGSSPAVYEDIPERPEVFNDDGDLIQEYRPAERVLVKEAIEAGSRYSVNYDEAMCLEAALVRSKLGI